MISTEARMEIDLSEEQAEKVLISNLEGFNPGSNDNAERK
jgi:hypothetical protein